VPGSLDGNEASTSVSLTDDREVRACCRVDVGFVPAGLKFRPAMGQLPRNIGFILDRRTHDHGSEPPCATK